MNAILDAIAVSRYRCFSDELRLSFRPITLLYGWNNAGKSAALRLLGLLNDSIKSEARAPFAASSPSGRGGSFLDIEWRGSSDTEETGFSFELHWRESTITSAKWRLDYSRELHESYVRALAIQTASGQVVSLKSARPGDTCDYELPDGTRATLRFSGLVPDIPDEARNNLAEATANTIRELRDLLQQLRGCLQWLSVDRGGIRREVPIDRGAPEVVSPNGDGVVEILTRDAELRHHVARWYASEHVSRELDVRESGRFRELVLRPNDGPGKGWDIPIAETGAGMSQVLPVLTAAAIAARVAHRGKSAVVAIEEPESQLHGNAMRALVEWLCELAQRDHPPYLLLETHSRAFLVAFQLAVAQQKLAPERFRLYWLSQDVNGSSRATIAELEASGMYKRDAQLPPTAFADELELSDLYVDRILAG